MRSGSRHETWVNASGSSVVGLGFDKCRRYADGSVAIGQQVKCVRVCDDEVGPKEGKKEEMIDRC